MITKRLLLRPPHFETELQPLALRRRSVFHMSLKTLFLLVALAASYFAGLLSQRALLFHAWQVAAEARQAEDFERTRAEVAEFNQLLGVLCDGSGVDLSAYVEENVVPAGGAGLDAARRPSKLIFDGKGLPASPWERNRTSDDAGPPPRETSLR